MCTAIQMGRPSKTRNGNDTSTSGRDATNDAVNAPFTSPVNLSFHPSAAASRDGQQGPAAVDGPGTRDVVTQQPDSTVDRCTLTSRKRSSTSANVLRQLQSPSATKTLGGGGKQTSMWLDGGENLAVVDRVVSGVERPRWIAGAAADLRVKRARYAGVPFLARAVHSPTVEPLADITATSRRWSLEAAEDVETCPAVYDMAVGSPSVTSSGRRDSLDDQDDDDDDDGPLMATDSEPWMRSSTSSPFASFADARRHRRRSSVDSLNRKQTSK